MKNDLSTMFEKKYYDESQRRVDDEQSRVQTDSAERFASLEKNKTFNLKLINEYHKGEEGVDYAFND